MRIEIQEPLSLSTHEEAMLAAHSFYNIMHIIVMELEYLRRVYGNPDALNKSGELCRDLIASFEDRQETLKAAENIESYRTTLETELKEARTKHTVAPKFEASEKSSHENLYKVFEILDIRVKEMLARQAAQAQWGWVATVAIEGGLREFFDAVAWNARDRYGIVYAPELQKENDYWIDLTVQGPDDLPGIPTANKAESRGLFIPLVLTDTLRDLSANARKYSKPGSRIGIILRDDGQEVLLEVTDQGRGIPENEVAEVVGYGIRATNTKPEETHGGGFGLTKAYYVCKQYGGRMWINSDIGKGTTITIRIPRPAAL